MKEKLEIFVIIIPAITSLVVILISNLVVLWKIRLDSKASLKRELTMQKIISLKKSLAEFYNPLFTLTSLLNDLVINFGRASFPDDRDLKTDAEFVWEQIVERVIIPTNRRIANVIEERSYLIDESDELEPYLAFVRHAESYEIFRRKRHESHQKFCYPKELDQHIRDVRQSILQRVMAAEKEIGRYLNRKL